MGAAELVEVRVAGAEAEEEVVITGSTPTPACLTCSTALSKNTWTRCMSGRPTWRGLGTGADRDTDHTPTNTRTNTPTHTRTLTHTGSPQPT